MRVLFATAVLLGGVVIGYSASGISAQTESTPAVVSVGDVVDITYPSEVTGAVPHCTVTGVQDGYVRCKDAEPTGVRRPKPETWHNLRIAWQVSKPPRDEFQVRWVGAAMREMAGTGAYGMPGPLA
jgi:hypothetical protein